MGIVKTTLTIIGIAREVTIIKGTIRIMASSKIKELTKIEI